MVTKTTSAIKLAGDQLLWNGGSRDSKLLYDIYHMQIMEGNIIDTIQNTVRTSAIFTQEVYPEETKLMRRRNYIIRYHESASKNQDIKVSLVREFVPSQKDKLESLRKCIQICDV